MSKKILITPKSFKFYRDKVYPIIRAKGYAIIENTTGYTLTESEIIDFAKKDVVGIIVGVDPLTATVLEKCKNLKAISKYGVGLDNIDVERAKTLGISVRNAPGTNKISVAEHTIALMFSIARSIPTIVIGVKKGKWARAMGSELTGKNLGLIGCGQIGKEVAKRAKGLMMKVAIYDPYFSDETFLKKYGIDRYSDIKELFCNSDVISLHVPLTSETKAIINKDTLKLMKMSAFLINTSRGELVDEEALYETLSNREIAGAAHDVFCCEPPNKGNRLLKLDNFILTSHIGAFTWEAVENMVITSTRNLLEMLS